MWLMTQYGFYSIVRKGRDVYHVRGRVKRDLENLVHLCGWKNTVEVWQKADYRYRVIVNKKQVMEAMHHLGNMIDYPNFKSQIAELDDQREKLTAYHRVWGELAGVQR